MKNDLIPTQSIGNQVDIVEQRLFHTATEATEFMKTVVIKFFDINNWDKVCGSASSDFIIVDQSTLEATHEVKEGNYIKIDIPGPSTGTGHGFDWVRIQKISHRDEENHEIVAMTVRPVSSPATENTDASHFFTGDASSTFIVERIDNLINAEVHGRNEVINDDTEITVDNIRNKMVGVGSKIGFSYPQWNSLAKGLIK